MAILDENHLLSEEQREAYFTLLKTYGYEPQHFVLEVLEDQGSMDMNDIQYVVIMKTQITHEKSQKSKSYISEAGSGAWVTEFEKDLKEGFFES